MLPQKKCGFKSIRWLSGVCVESKDWFPIPFNNFKLWQFWDCLKFKRLFPLHLSCSPSDAVLMRDGLVMVACITQSSLRGLFWCDTFTPTGIPRSILVILTVLQYSYNTNKCVRMKFKWKRLLVFKTWLSFHLMRMFSGKLRAFGENRLKKVPDWMFESTQLTSWPMTDQQ